MFFYYNFEHINAALVSVKVCSKTKANKTKDLFPPGFEPGTFRVWGERDNHYTTETLCSMKAVSFTNGLMLY